VENTHLANVFTHELRQQHIWSGRFRPESTLFLSFKKKDLSMHTENDIPPSGVKWQAESLTDTLVESGLASIWWLRKENSCESCWHMLGGTLKGTYTTRLHMSKNHQHK